MLSTTDVWQYPDQNQTVNDQDSAVSAKRKTKRRLLHAVLLLVLSLIIELFLWNSYFWSFDAKTYPRQVIELPYQEVLQRRAAVVLQKEPYLALSGLNTMIRAVEIEAYGGDFRVTGQIMATSQNFAHKPQRISTFVVASGLNSDLDSPAQDYQRTLVKFDLIEPVIDLMIRFDADTIPRPLIITRIVLNPDPQLNFSWVRTLLTLLGLFLVYAVVCSKLYRYQVIVDGKGYKWLNRGVFVAMLLYATGIFVAYHPHFATSTGFRPIAMGLFPYTTPNRTALQEIPKTQEALGNVDLYIQLTDALLVKKQLNLDLWVDPKLMQLNNVYDRTEREAKQAQYYWDRAFYEGKYYCYYGLAPVLMIYAPIFLLTGLVPGPACAVFIATLYALLGLHMLSSRLTSLLCDECNALLLVVTKLTLFMSSMVFYAQGQFVFYNLPYLTAFAAVGIALSCGLGLLMRPKLGKKEQQRQLRMLQNPALARDFRVRGFVNPQRVVKQMQDALRLAAQTQDKAQAQTQGNQDSDNATTVDAKSTGFMAKLGAMWADVKDSLQSKTSEKLPYNLDLRQMGAMFLCGCCVVLTVMSRPLLLLYLIAGVGLCYIIYMFKAQISIKAKLVNSFCLFAPVIVGAVVIAAYNYARFDSITEFGQYMQLTVDDVNHKAIGFNLSYIKTFIFNVLMVNFELSSVFPFVNTNSHGEQYLGQYQFYTTRSGLLMIPYYWGLFLLPVLWGIKRLSFQGLYRVLPSLEHKLALRSIQVMFSLFYVIGAVLLVFTAYNAGWNNRYLMDVTIVLAMVPFICMMLVEFRWESGADRILYMGWIVCCIFSCLLMFFLVINNGSVEILRLNPRLYLELKDIFDPLGFN